MVRAQGVVRLAGVALLLFGCTAAVDSAEPEPIVDETIGPSVTEVVSEVVSEVRPKTEPGPPPTQPAGNFDRGPGFRPPVGFPDSFNEFAPIVELGPELLIVESRGGDVPHWAWQRSTGWRRGDPDPDVPHKFDAFDAGVDSGVVGPQALEWRGHPLLISFTDDSAITIDAVSGTPIVPPSERVFAAVHSDWLAYGPTVSTDQSKTIGLVSVDDPTRRRSFVFDYASNIELVGLVQDRFVILQKQQTLFDGSTDTLVTSFAVVDLVEDQIRTRPLPPGSSILRVLGFGPGEEPPVAGSLDAAHNRYEAGLVACEDTWRKLDGFVVSIRLDGRRVEAVVAANGPEQMPRGTVAVAGDRSLTLIEERLRSTDGSIDLALAEGFVSGQVSRAYAMVGDDSLLITGFAPTGELLVTALDANGISRWDRTIDVGIEEAGLTQQLTTKRSVYLAIAPVEGGRAVSMVRVDLDGVVHGPTGLPDDTAFSFTPLVAFPDGTIAVFRADGAVTAIDGTAVLMADEPIAHLIGQDGKRLAFRDTAGQLFVADLETGELTDVGGHCEVWPTAFSFNP